VVDDAGRQPEDALLDRFEGLERDPRRLGRRGDVSSLWHS